MLAGVSELGRAVDAGRYVILIPVYNDWRAAEALLEELDRALAITPHDFTLVMVDDGSRQRPSPEILGSPRRAFRTIELLRLRRNLGHQRAIAVGIAYVHSHHNCSGLVIMDADGEDPPEAVPSLIREFEGNGRNTVIFAARKKRSEGLAFRILYLIYKLGHLVLVGFPVRVGNFSVLPSTMLENVLCMPELWNHYAAAVFKSRLPRGELPVARNPRLHGRSQMSMSGLVIHGLSAMSVFGENVGVRVLLSSIWMLLISSTSFVALYFLNLSWNDWPLLSILAWLGAGSLLIGILALGFTFMVLYARSQSAFLPLRDCQEFIKSVEQYECRTPRMLVAN